MGPAVQHERMGWGRQYIGDRCRMLHDCGLVDEHGRGVYTINEAGVESLNEELDAGELAAHDE